MLESQLGPSRHSAVGERHERAAPSRAIRQEFRYRNIAGSGIAYEAVAIRISLASDLHERVIIINTVQSPTAAVQSNKSTQHHQWDNTLPIGRALPNVVAAVACADRFDIFCLVTGKILQCMLPAFGAKRGDQSRAIQPS